MTNLTHDLAAVLDRHGIAWALDGVMNSLDSAGVFDKTWTEDEENR